MKNYFEIIKVIALYFNLLSYMEIKDIKNWKKNTVTTELAESAIKILDADKEEVELMVARNAFILEEMKNKSKAEGKAEGVELTKRIFKLYAQGISIEKIADECKISEEEVKSILD